MTGQQLGDPCPQCSGRLIVLNTIVQDDSRIRYFGCSDCGHRPEHNKQVIPLQFAPRRRSLRRLRTRPLNAPPPSD